MGLGYGSRPVKARATPNQGGGGPEDIEQLVNDVEEESDEDELDADHGPLQLDLNENSVSSLNVVSSKTNLRFHLDKRTKTVQGLLEKMFESELKDGDLLEEAS